MTSEQVLIDFIDAAKHRDPEQLEHRAVLLAAAEPQLCQALEIVSDMLLSEWQKYRKQPMVLVGMLKRIRRATSSAGS